MEDVKQVNAWDKEASTRSGQNGKKETVKSTSVAIPERTPSPRLHSRISRVSGTVIIIAKDCYISVEHPMLAFSRTCSLLSFSVGSCSIQSWGINSNLVSKKTLRLASHCEKCSSAWIDR